MQIDVYGSLLESLIGSLIESLISSYSDAHLAARFSRRVPRDSAMQSHVTGFQLLESDFESGSSGRELY